MSFPFFGPWGRWYPWYTAGFGGGLGYLSYNPWGYSATCWGWDRYATWFDPFSYCWNPYSSPVGIGGGGGGARAEKPRETTGSLRIKASPASANVYINGALAGTVDEFDGLSDHLDLEGGRHIIELRAPGYETWSEEVVVVIGKTQTVRASLKKAK